MALMHDALQLCHASARRALSEAEVLTIERAAKLGGMNSEMIDEALDQAEQVVRRERTLRGIGRESGSISPTGDGDGSGRTLADAIHNAGFDRREHPAVEVPFDAAVTFDGDIEEANARFVRHAPLGHDERWLFTSLPTIGLASDETGVRSFRQISRDLASGDDVIREIAATSPKPETGTTIEVVLAALHQLATVSSGVPNVMIESGEVRSFINTDLRLAWSNAVDQHVLGEIADATPPAASDGTNILEQAFYAAEVVRSAGYTPTVAALSPGDALALELLMLEDGDAYVRQPTLPVRVVVSKSVVDGAGIVLDTGAAGTLYMSPLRFAIFEENSGRTNSSTARLENNGLYLLQRREAIATLQ